jgi:hypothetical protein
MGLHQRRARRPQGLRRPAQSVLAVSALVDRELRESEVEQSIRILPDGTLQVGKSAFVVTLLQP